MAHRILIVDDSTTTRAVIRRVLAMSGVATEKVIEAANGRDALAVLKVTRVDLVFLDLNMPEMGGAEVLAAVRADARTAAVPVVIVSSESLEHRKRQLLAAGASDYVTKPFTPEQIRGVFRRILGAADAA